MTKRPRSWKAWIILGLGIAAAVWIASTSRSFRGCVDQRKNEESYKVLRESPSVVRRAIVRGRLDIICSGEFTDKNEGAITALATLLIAIFTATLWSATSRLWDAALDQGEAMERHISHAGRSAEAMERVADAISAQVESTKGFWLRQMRAYISVGPGAAIDQDELTAGTFFECQPIIQNDGLTPAHEVVVVSRCGLHPNPLPPEFDFNVTPSGPPSVSTMNPRTNSFTIVVADRRYTAAEVQEYRNPGGRRIYVWGSVRYRDVSNGWHHTNYCFYFIWGSKSKPLWMRTEHHNDSD